MCRIESYYNFNFIYKSMGGFILRGVNVIVGEVNENYFKPKRILMVFLNQTDQIIFDINFKNPTGL